MKVCFETFGCRLNKAEALQMEAEYLARGWTLTDKHSDADLFVVRGCSVTSHAQHECERLVSHLRRHHPTTPLRVCGCIEDKGLSHGLRRGSDAIPPSPRPLGLSRFLSAKAKPLPPAASASDGFAARANPVPTRTARAYLKVQDGCSGRCTFCIVPKFRGKSVSVPFPELLDRAKRFIDAGYHEIVVTGCNLSLYASEGKRLPELVAALADLTGSTTVAAPNAESSEDAKPANPFAATDCRIRIGSLEPGDCALETVDAMSEHANVCRFLHIPVQSGSNHILAMMRRPYLAKDVDSLVAKARRLMPDIGLGCDLMTGFPGESELDFAATKGLLARLKFSNAHVFPFSSRPGTIAAASRDVVPKELRSSRAHLLAHDTRHLRNHFARTFVGKIVEIVVEDESKCVGWTGEYLRCKATGDAPRKSLAKVFVTRANGDELIGRIAKADDPKQRS